MPYSDGSSFFGCKISEEAADGCGCSWVDEMELNEDVFGSSEVLREEEEEEKEF